MSITSTTNAGDPPPRVRVWADVDQYARAMGVALAETEAPVRRLFLDDVVEASSDRREELRTLMPFDPDVRDLRAPKHEGWIRDRALAASRRLCDDAEIVAIEYAIAVGLRDVPDGMHLVVVRMLGTRRA